MTRTAISPRLATSTRENTLKRVERAPVEGLELEEQLSVLDRLGVLDVDRPHRAGNVRLELVEQLHRLEDAERLAGFDDVADFDVGRGARVPGAVERADHR